MNLRSYENDDKFQFWKIPNIKEKLRSFLDSEPLEIESLCRWVVQQCKENS